MIWRTISSGESSAFVLSVTKNYVCLSTLPDVYQGNNSTLQYHYFATTFVDVCHVFEC